MGGAGQRRLQKDYLFFFPHITQTSLSLGMCPWKESRGIPIHPSFCPFSLLILGYWFPVGFTGKGKEPGKPSKLQSWARERKNPMARAGPDGFRTPLSEILGCEMKVGTSQPPSPPPASPPEANPPGIAPGEGIQHPGLPQPSPWEALRGDRVVGTGLKATRGALGPG